jgi:hypothetical protein
MEENTVDLGLEWDGTCPFCNVKEVNKKTEIHIGEYIYCHMQCKSCGKNYIEKYILAFLGKFDFEENQLPIKRDKTCMDDEFLNVVNFMLRDDKDNNER